ncbi:hypothetical protein E6C76_12000 [Pseudothauera nasutitermitis]|uniref:Ubiquinone biosynthesis accessory factor UbiJ n=1 Tax=Pseudothauera nasutitermitis TaxID=2565930 RepID=A0A4S4AXI1_9RHOO|nr:SCP2 sterol-binding domain-containing protein [Pseudothauera nasutitermitis]THF64764.1 hypothetical protein E6C76_12000 [Pseudothauera nasutitermitis]
MLDQAFIAVLNHLLAAAPWARERLAPHAGLTARLRLEAFELRFGVGTDGLATPAAADAPADVVLGVPLGELPNFALGRFEDAMRRVHLEGNAEFADALGFVFRNLRWDAEEDLARVFGDVAAHRLGETVRAAGVAQRRLVESASGNLAEYLTEERALLVSASAGRTFAEDARALRDALARLEKRIERIERAQPRPAR